MDSTMIAHLFIFLLALAAGGELVKGMARERNPVLLAALAALAGGVLLAALPLAGQRAGMGRAGLLGILAVACAMVNLGGGYLACHRSLTAAPPPGPETP